MNIDRSDPKPGIVITLEGIDAAGKSTITKVLVKEAKRAGILARAFMNEGERPGFLNSLQKLITEFRKDPGMYNAATHAILSYAYFQYLTEAHVFPFVASGGLALLDRYVHSVVVYSSILGVDEEWVMHLLSTLPTPDGTIFLDVDPALSVRTKNDSLPVHLLEEARSSYNRLLFENRWKVNNAISLHRNDNSVDQLVQYSMSFISEILANGG